MDNGDANHKDQTLNFFAMGIREAVGATQGKDGNAPRAIAAIFFFALAFIFSGVEAVKILLRRDFAKNSIDLFPLLLSGLSFIGWGGWCLSVPVSILMFADSNIDISPIGSIASFVIGGLFYLFVGLRVLVRGYGEWKNSHNEDGGTTLGVSTILGFLRDSGWSEYQIKQIAEPSLLFATGVLLSGINLFLGIPLFFCGVSSVAFNLLSYKQKVENTPLRARRGGKMNDDENFVK